MRRIMICLQGIGPPLMPFGCRPGRSLADSGSVAYWGGGMAGRYPAHRRAAGWAGRLRSTTRKFAVGPGGNPALWRACGLDQDFKIAPRVQPADAA
jgi:hypothetical protein